MKKYFGFVLLLVLAISASLFVGCGKVDFKLNFIVDGEVRATISTKGEESIKLPANPEKEGYVFDGWYWDNDVWKKPFTANSLLDTPLSSDMSVYAKFEKEEAVKGTQAEFVGFEKTGENKYLKKVPNDTEIFSLGTSVKVNSKSSWQLSSDVYGNNVIASKTATLSAGDNYYYVNVIADDGTMQLYVLNIRRREIYTVTFADCDVQPQYIEEDSCVVAPETANRTGYTFESWNFDFTAPIVENTIINANWNVVTYNIEYDLNGGENNSENPTTYTIESEDIILQTPSKTGYDFAGWYIIGSSGGVDLPTIPINQYSATYAVVALPTIPIDGKKDEQVETKVNCIKKGSYGNKKFFAKWTPTFYNIEYELNGGKNNSLNPLVYTIESEEIVLQTPSKTGYDFVGWYADETFSEKVEKIEKGTLGRKKFYAKWTPTVYNIEYELNGGENNVDNLTIYTIESEDIVLEKPTKLDYDFCGWYLDKTFSVSVEKIEKGSFGYKKIYAKWASVYYLFDDNNGTIMGLTDYGKTCASLVISDKINDVAVRKIGDSAFYNCRHLTSITIPDSVINIDNSAFRGCTGLTSVTIPDSVISLGDSAFECCSGIESIMVDVNNPVYYSSNNCFIKKQSKTLVLGCKNSVIPNDGSVTSIGNSSFSGCTGLASVIIPDSVTSIGNSAFRGCTGLTSVIIPDSVTSIGRSAFESCAGLTSVTIPNSVVSVDYCVFNGCDRLTNIVIPNNVKSINCKAICGFWLRKITFIGTYEEWHDISIFHVSSIFNKKGFNYNEHYVVVFCTVGNDEFMLF